MRYFHDNDDSPIIVNWIVSIVGGLVLLFVLMFATFACARAYERRQRIWDEQNQVQVNSIRIQQQAQLIKVEQQKAEIRVVEAGGIAQAQKIINETLTDKYLQHEAITAQLRMADSPNHTTIYIPSGYSGIPLVRTVNDEPEHPTPPVKEKK